MTFEEVYQEALSKTMAAVSSAQTLRESFSDVCVEVPLGPLSRNDMVVIWGEEKRPIRDIVTAEGVIASGICFFMIITFTIMR